MSLPLLSYAPTSQNSRVAGFEIPGDEQPRIFNAETLATPSEVDQLIQSAYLRIFHEQQMLSSNRQTFLESQLRNGQITVKEFIRGLATSDSFRRLNYDVNNNYRFVELCVQRILGRNVYSEREKLAWSIILATQGLNGFISQLLDSEEYNTAFGSQIVPYQRRRVLPQRNQGELPFERVARYGTSYRDRLPKSSGRSYVSRSSFNYNESDKFARFDLDTFLQSADWATVSGLSILVLLAIIALVGVSMSAAG